MAQNSMTTATVPKLTKREKEVLTLLAYGAPRKEMAAKLGLSVRTIDFHVQAIYEKLEVNSRMKAYHKAVRLGLIEVSNAHRT